MRDSSLRGELSFDIAGIWILLRRMLWDCIHSPRWCAGTDVAVHAPCPCLCCEFGSKRCTRTHVESPQWTQPSQQQSDKLSDAKLSQNALGSRNLLQSFSFCFDGRECRNHCDHGCDGSKDAEEGGLPT